MIIGGSPLGGPRQLSGEPVHSVGGRLPAIWLATGVCMHSPYDQQLQAYVCLLTDQMCPASLGCSNCLAVTTYHLKSFAGIKILIGKTQLP